MYKGETIDDLAMCKLNLPNHKIDLLAHLRSSYTNYKLNGCKEDARYFIEQFSNILNSKQFKQTISFLGATVVDDRKAYNVRVTYTSAMTGTQTFTFLRVPHIDNNGILQFDSPRAFQNILVKSEGFTRKDDMIRLQCEKISLKFRIDKKAREIVFVLPGTGSRKIPLSELIIYTACKFGLLDINFSDSTVAEKFVRENFSGRLMDSMASKLRGKFTRTIYETVSKTLGNFDLFTIELGNARTELREKINFKNAEDFKLAFDTDNIPAGTLLTSEIIKNISSDTIWVEYMPDITSFVTANSLNDCTIKAGTRVTEALINTYPELNGMSYVPVDLENTNLHISAGTYINEELNELLYTLADNKSINVATSKTGSSTIDIRCYKDVRRIVDDTSSTFTCQDIFALVSYLTNSFEMPETFIVNKEDLDFSKKIRTFEDSMSFYLRRAIDNQLRVFFSTTYQSFLNNNLEAPMSQMVNSIWRDMFTDKVLAVPSYQNPNILLYHTRAVTTTIVGHEAADSMRALLMGHYGKLCPFDTPAGKNIGLTNSLAIGCQIEDGIAYTPYYRVCYDGATVRIDTSDIIWLSAEDEKHYKIASIMALEPEDPTKPIGNTTIKNTSIPARVPVATKDEHEDITIENVHVSDLDFVSVYENQAISVTLSLIPFLGADDGARAQFAGSMLRQSVPLVEAEKPRVYTSIYRDLVETTNLVVYAEQDGEVVNLKQSSLTVRYVDGTTKTYNLKLETHGNWLTIYTPKVHLGDTFEQGDLLIESTQARGGMYTPGRNVMVAYMPYYGFNFDDAIVMSKTCASHFSSPIVETITVECGNDRENNWKVSTNNTMRFVGPNQVIGTIRGRSASKAGRKVLTTLQKHGIFCKASKSVDDANDRAIFTFTFLKTEQAQVGDKFAARHGNKGVNSKQVPDSEMPYFKNGTTIDVVQNPCGIGSRMNPGQVIEALLGFCCYLLDIYIKSDSFNGAVKEEIQELLSYCYDMCNSESEEEAQQIIRQYPNIPACIHVRALDRLEFLQTWAGCFNKDGQAILYNGKTGKPFYYPVLVGNVYYIKLEHEVEHKRNERGGLCNDYMQVSKQPPKGTDKHGGQAIGEMELWALTAQGAATAISEILNEKSDNVYIREKMRATPKNVAYTKDWDNDWKTSNQAVETFRYYLEALGIKLETEVGSDLSREAIMEHLQNTDTDIIDDNIFNDDLTGFYSDEDLAEFDASYKAADEGEREDVATSSMQQAEECDDEPKHIVLAVTSSNNNASYGIGQRIVILDTCLNENGSTVFIEVVCYYIGNKDRIWMENRALEFSKDNGLYLQDVTDPKSFSKMSIDTTTNLVCFADPKSENSSDLIYGVFLGEIDNVTSPSEIYQRYFDRFE